jgi:hypothetical protein
LEGAFCLEGYPKVEREGPLQISLCPLLDFIFERNPQKTVVLLVTDWYLPMPTQVMRQMKGSKGNPAGISVRVKGYI